MDAKDGERESSATGRKLNWCCCMATVYKLEVAEKGVADGESDGVEGFRIRKDDKIENDGIGWISEYTGRSNLKADRCSAARARTGENRIVTPSRHSAAARPRHAGDRAGRGGWHALT